VAYTVLDANRWLRRAARFVFEGCEFIATIRRGNSGFCTAKDPRPRQDLQTRILLAWAARKRHAPRENGRPVSPPVAAVFQYGLSAFLSTKGDFGLENGRTDSNTRS
jgi:hypothetical protein